MIKFTAPEDRIVHSTIEKVTEKERSLLKVILEDPGYTMDEMASRLSVSRKTVSVWLKALKEKGIIRRIGSTKTGHWEIND